MRKFNIELTEEQMWLIANCMEDICRFASGQMELRNTLPRVIEENDDFYDTKDTVESKLYELKKLIFPKLQHNEFLGYDSNPFIGNVYQVYRTMKYHLLKDNVSDYNVYNSPALPSGDMGIIKITEIKNAKKYWQKIAMNKNISEIKKSLFSNIGEKVTISDSLLDELLFHYGYLRQSLKVSNDYFQRVAIQNQIEGLENFLSKTLKLF